MYLKGYLDVFIIGLVGFLTTFLVFWAIPTNYELLAMCFIGFNVGTSLGGSLSEQYRKKHIIMWWADSFSPCLALIIISFMNFNLSGQLLVGLLITVGVIIGWLSRNSSRETFEAALRSDKKPWSIPTRIVLAPFFIAILFLMLITAAIAMTLSYPTILVVRWILKRNTKKAIYDAGIQILGRR